VNDEERAWVQSLEERVAILETQLAELLAQLQAQAAANLGPAAGLRRFRASLTSQQGGATE
jgi:uncharacterized small protein (DUF1192 family)